VHERRIAQALLHGLTGVGIIAIITKIHRWDESAMFFDGGSLGERFHVHFSTPFHFNRGGGGGKGVHTFHSLLAPGTEMEKFLLGKKKKKRNEKLNVLDLL
jgi:hypothetical protein